MKWMFIENIVIYLSIVSISLGIYYMGGGASGLWSLLLISAINSNIIKSTEK